MKNINIEEVNARNECVINFNIYSSLFEERINKLSLPRKYNLANIIRNEIYNLEEKFSEYKENSFYSSISGQFLILLFSSILNLELDELDEAYFRFNKSMLNTLIYSVMPMKRLTNYILLCLSMNSFNISDYIEELTAMFCAYVSEKNIPQDKIEELYVQFEQELNILQTKKEENITKKIGTI